MAANEKLVRVVLEAARDVNGKKMLSCSEAFRIAAEHNVKPLQIGQICNRHKIRLDQCQLGCF